MRSRATGFAVRVIALALTSAALLACTTRVPLADGYLGPAALPEGGFAVVLPLPPQPPEVADDVEARMRAHFVVREISLAADNSADSNEPIEFEYYDVDGDSRTPVVVLLPIFNGQLGIPRYFARYFANQGLASVVVTRGRDPLAALTAPAETVQGNLLDYRRVLDWIEQQPELDARRIGLFGMSLGGMDAVMLAAFDHRVQAVVVAMAGGDFSYLLANTNYRRVVRTIGQMAEELGTSRAQVVAQLDAAIKLDPLAVARYVDAERVLMILTRTDAIVPFEAQQELRASMGSPESLYLATGHRLSFVFFPKVRSEAFAFFARMFEEQPVALAETNRRPIEWFAADAVGIQ
jgi:dienelactone hydrolase